MAFGWFMQIHVLEVKLLFLFLCDFGNALGGLPLPKGSAAKRKYIPVFPLNAKKVRIFEIISGGFAVKIQQCVKKVRRFLVRFSVC